MLYITTQSVWAESAFAGLWSIRMPRWQSQQQREPSHQDWWVGKQQQKETVEKQSALELHYQLPIIWGCLLVVLETIKRIPALGKDNQPIVFIPPGRSCFALDGNSSRFSSLLDKEIEFLRVNGRSFRIHFLEACCRTKLLLVERKKLAGFY